ncbi:MAG: PEP-CTERM sorting domain-containing protein [Gemmatimonadaceae bacterium]
MRRNPRRALVVVAILSSSFSAHDARAQGWTTLPNGTLGYATSYVTSGMFFCGNYYPPGTCQSFGNSVILTSGTSVLTMSFQGIANAVTALTTNGQVVPLGSFTRTWNAGAPYVLPKSFIGPQQPMFYFNYQLSLTSPFPQTKSWTVGWLNTNNTLDAFTPGGSALGFSVTPPPSPATYGVLAFGDFTVADTPADPGTSQVYATVSVAPEPTSIALLSTGLIGVLGIARRHRRKSDRST